MQTVKIQKTAFEKLRHVVTDNYYNYKQDAINLEYDYDDPTNSEETFKKKWQDKYNIKICWKWRLSNFYSRQWQSQGNKLYLP